MRSPEHFRRLAQAVLALNLPVILWGAYVRASFSGDGCGQHWPTCNGELLPLDAPTKTLVELTHRLTAGFSVIAAVVLAVAAWRVFAPRHPARRAALAVLAFTFSEALIGAGLVLFRYVAHDERAGRIPFMALHLLNTFALLAAQVRAIQAAGGARLELRRLSSGAALSVAAVAALAILAVSGALTALGDTLHPATSLAAGLRADWSPASTLLLRLRVIHPVLALATAVLCGASVAAGAAYPEARSGAYALGALLFVQMGVGVVNLALLAPIATQLLHLLGADLVWIAQVWVAGAILTSRATEPVAVVPPLSPAVG